MILERSDETEAADDRKNLLDVLKKVLDFLRTVW